MKDRIGLTLADGTTLVHDAAIGCGKTSGMAKGLFLCSRGRVCAGESAGIGLPVWKTMFRTIFPSVVSAVQVDEMAVVKVFGMDRNLSWHIAGTKLPVWFSYVVEKIVEGFMKMPAFQQRALRLRSAVMAGFGIRCTMEAGSARGLCSVTYEAVPQGVTIMADGTGLEGKGRLFMLNEADGSAFDLMIVKGRPCLGRQIPAWENASSDTLCVSRTLDIGFSLSPVGIEDRPDGRVFYGREVAPGLDWAGIALAIDEKKCSYMVNIRHVKSEIDEHHLCFDIAHHSVFDR